MTSIASVQYFITECVIIIIKLCKYICTIQHNECIVCVIVLNALLSSGSYTSQCTYVPLQLGYTNQLDKHTVLVILKQNLRAAKFNKLNSVHDIVTNV